MSYREDFPIGMLEPCKLATSPIGKNQLVGPESRHYS
jgi:hypothetical protein